MSTSHRHHLNRFLQGRLCRAAGVLVTAASLALTGCGDDPTPQGSDVPIGTDLPSVDTPIFPEVGPDDGGSETTEARTPLAGEVIFTELMVDPVAVADDQGEWFEVHNVTTDPLELTGCSLSSLSDFAYEITTPLTIAPGGFLVFGRNADSAVNGGVTIDDARSGIGLDNDDDSLTLTCDGTTIDQVVYNEAAGWPTGLGRAMVLSADALTADGNDSSDSWCDALDAYGDGDYGTPGAANPVCSGTNPCDPNPCLNPPLAQCNGDVLSIFSSPGTCTNDAGTAVCDYPVTTTDCQAQFAGTCNSGLCTGAPSSPSSPGDLLITEIMKDPAVVGDAAGEWLEIYNATANPLLLSNCTLISTGDDPFALGSGVTIAAGQYLVLGRESDDILNGGVTLDIAYGNAITLGNPTDDLEVRCNGLLIDRVVYDDSGTWPDAAGKSLSLNPNALDGTANDQPGAWCAGSTIYGQGDFGSPGTANPTCPDACTGVVCNTPPAPTCVDGDVQSFAATGQCSDGSCSYAPAGLQNCGVQICQAGECVDPIAVAPAPTAGQLVITEIMQNPASVSDANGEWFEVTSLAAEDVELSGCTLNAGSSTHVIAPEGSLVLSAGQVAVFADNGTSATNGGVAVDYVYSGIGLGNGDADLAIQCGTTLIDAVAWDNGNTFPDPNGASMYLDGGSIDATANDAGDQWCEGFAAFGDGDLGSPGQLNGPCPEACDLVTCDAPPAATCVGNTATTYETVGTCTNGVCDYAVATATDCGAQPCLAGTCATGGAPHPGSGDVIVTEFMSNPAAVSDSAGEWVEFLNVSSIEVTLQGCVLRDGGSNTHTILDNVLVAPNARVVLGKSADTSANGNVPVAYAYGGDFTMSNSNPDDIILECSGTLVDSVTYNGSWPNASGVSAQLEPDVIDATANNAVANWCASGNAWSGGDLGSPGAANPVCQSDPCQGVVCDSPPADFCTGDVAHTYNASGTCDGGSCSYAESTETCSGSEMCTDGVCVPTSTNAPEAGELVITEIFYDGTGSDDGKEWVELFNATSETLDLQGCTLEDNSSTTTIDAGGPLPVAPGAYIVLAETTNLTANGGVAADYGYGPVPSLNNDTDSVTVRCGGVVVDSVVYDGSFPSASGASLSLDAGSMTAAANDSGSSWCVADAGDVMSGGDLGTPGASNGSCPGGATLPPTAGDVVITEIFYDYSFGGVSADDDKEWFEVRNVGSESYDLDGCDITDGEATVTIDTGGALVIAPGDRLVFGQSASAANNGGANVDVAYGGSIVLGNSGDQVELRCGGTLIDGVDYNVSGFPDPVGASISLDPGSETAGSNNTGTNWCAGTATYGDGALGTPGLANDACGGSTGGGCDDPPPPTCVSGALETYELAGTVVNGKCTYAVASSVPCSAGDICQAGACVDPATSNVFDAVTFGEAGDLVITEIMFNPQGVSDTDGEWFEVFNYSFDDLEFSGCQITSSGDGIHTIAPNGSVVIPAFEFAVFGVNRDITTNGGAPVDYVYSGVSMTNSSGDDVTIQCGGTLIDTVDYSQGFPLPNGESLQMDDATLQNAADKAAAASANDNASAWCATDGATTYGSDGNAGTPKDFNADCP